MGSWNRKCGTDPCEVQRRPVYCLLPGGAGCDPESKPVGFRQCSNITCGHWVVGDWSQVNITLTIILLTTYNFFFIFTRHITFA